MSLILLLPLSKQQFPQFPIPTTTWHRVSSLAKKITIQKKHCTCHQTCILQPSGIFLWDFSPAALEAAESTADPDSSRQDLFLQKHFFNAQQTLVTAQRSLTLVTKPLVKMSLENQPCCCTASRAGLAAHTTERGHADLLPICFFGARWTFFHRGTIFLLRWNSMRFVLFQKDFSKRLFIGALVDVVVLCIPHTGIWDCGAINEHLEHSSRNLDTPHLSKCWSHRPPSLLFATFCPLRSRSWIVSS